MFSRILIANRAEIACRVARTCRRLGVETVAVHSAADAGSPHVAAADRAVALSGESPGDGYLDGAQLVEAALRCGAVAVHPGYGFLSENADFAAACESAGLVFIGPGTSTIREMGDKARARRLAQEAGVATVPGVEEALSQTGAAGADGALCEAATRLGYPLMVKACAGGGGRGLRRVEKAADLPGAIALARREAMAGFGDDRLIVERYVLRPRHVEVQVLADHHGTVIHLHERDCSIQRRHQKLVEEAPAPGLEQTTREALHRAALELARAIDYRNAGTVEFILDPADGAFYFLEMNTRLQVEHPVTEAVFGLDLVEWQLRIAAGEALTLCQADLEPRGWAMEARINAEDPGRDFQPDSGTLLRYREPAGEGVRVDSAVMEGSRVAPWYDALLAKVIVHGRDRHDAARRLARALDGMCLMGVRSNAAFLAQVARLDAFRAGQVNTDFIEEHFPAGWRPPVSGEDSALAAAAWLSAREEVHGGPWTQLGGWRVLERAGHPGRWRLLFDDGGPSVRAVWVARRGDGWHMWVADAKSPPGAPGSATAVAALRDDAGLTLELDGGRLCFEIVEHDGRLHLYSAGGWSELRVLAPEHALHGGDGGAGGAHGPVQAPVPGIIASVEVAAGDEVEAGAALVVIESMKMFQTIAAPAPSRVVGLQCAPGDAVRAGQALLTLMPPGEEPGE